MWVARYQPVAIGEGLGTVLWQEAGSRETAFTEEATAFSWRRTWRLWCIF